MTPAPLTHEEVQRNAGGLAALPERDSERVAAFAHARDCPACAQALRQGALLQLVLGRAQLPGPSAEALRRTKALILAELKPASSPGWGVPGLTAALTLLAFPLLALMGTQPRAWSFLDQSAVAALLAAACAVLATSSWRKLAAPLALFVSVALLFINAAPPHFAGLYGSSCGVVELLGAALPLGAVAALALRGRTEGGALLFAGVAAAGALAGQAALGLTCPDRGDFGHVAVFHVGTVLVAALLGAAVSRMPGLHATLPASS